MDGSYLWIGVGLSVLCLTLIGFEFLWHPGRPRRKVRRLSELQRDFHHQRERLEAKFVQIGLRASALSGPHWADCEFDDDVVYARHRGTGEFSAFVAVTVEIDGDDLGTSDQEDGGRHFCEATAVFRFDQEHWETDGRAIFNLTPTEAIRFHQPELKMICQELAVRS